MDSAHFYSEKKYKEAFASLGIERVQEGTKGYVEISKNRRRQRASVQSELDAKDYEKYWMIRRDESWSPIPSMRVWSRKERKIVHIYLVTKILVYLAPKSAFNPWIVWKRIKAKREQQLIEQQNAKAVTKAKSKLDQMKEANTQSKVLDKEVKEVSLIRNNKDHLNNKDQLAVLIKKATTKIARDVLLVEILKKAVKDQNLIELYDVLWAIESTQLTAQSTTRSERDPQLVYDNYRDVEKLLDEARKLRSRESDLVRFQLMEMSDRLPPLSMYVFDFKLDEWQIRALEFIDAGKSLVICAPTSSGKTVLSTYVALISSKMQADVPDDDKDTRQVTRDLKNKASVKSTKPAAEMVDGELIEVQDEDEEGVEGESDDEDEDDEDDEEGEQVGRKPRAGDSLNSLRDLSENAIRADRIARLNFRKLNPDGLQRVLFVVPSEPLVWQVAAFFTKLLKDEGETESKVAIVTNQMTYYPARKFNVMPQIVVGTPLALESSLTKCRGLVGRFETAHKAQGDLLPGGFDHFDWAIFDEVHAIDGEEGDALQRLIRAMNCKFLALSATVGNADELLGWIERAKGDQLVGVEKMTVLPEEVHYYGTGVSAPVVAPPLPQADGEAGESVDKKDKKKGKAAGSENVPNITLTVHRVLDKATFTVPELSKSSTVAELKLKLWKLLLPGEREPEYSQLALSLPGGANELLTDDAATLESLKLQSGAAVNLVTFDVQIVRTVDQQCITVCHVSPKCTLSSLRHRICHHWPSFTADGLQLLFLKPLANDSPNLTLTKAVEAGAMTLELPSNKSINKDCVLVIGSESVAKEVVSVAAVTHTDTATTVSAHHPLHKAYSAGTPYEVCEMRDLKSNTATLLSCQVYNPTLAASASVPVIQVRSLVNLLQHQGRFINLQRYVWHNSKLLPMSPLAAVDSTEQLVDGILDKSSLSFTSRDSYRLWLELEKLYPASAVARFNPHTFFSSGSRITLQQTKEYEDCLKQGLKDLAQQFPVETRELLYAFRLEDPAKDIDLCELCLKLRDEKLLPGLVFNLNTFEAIALFKQLLAGLEWRQKRDFPLYYEDLQAEKNRLRDNNERLQKATGRNEKEAEELERSGDLATDQDFTVNPFEPHPKYRFTVGSNVMTEDEFTLLCEDMERHDGFAKRNEATRGQNETVLSHALMRGLRRGIGLYINEVSSPAYRRAVQKLASLGKLGVVISDDSLAFGVNMPFRSCVFCGEMSGSLTPLMAQQMSGRAGRRGLDTQGNLVYAGARASFIRSLMIGQVANITGNLFPPRYETVFLQGLLATRYVGWSRSEGQGGRSLDEFASGRALAPSQYTLEYSRRVLTDLGLIVQSAETGEWLPSEEWESLVLVWELRSKVSESVILGRLLPELSLAIEKKTRDLMLSPAAQTAVPNERAATKERDNKYVPFFYSILLQLIDRHEHDPQSGLPPLHELPEFSPAHPFAHKMFFEWSELFKKDQESMPEYLAHLKAAVPPGAPLDSTLYNCILQPNLVHSFSGERKQQLKARIWSVGSTVKTMLNSLWPNNRYCNSMAACLRVCFRHLFYLNAELVRAQINFDDVSAAAKEKRTDREVGQALPVTEQAKPWHDTTESDGAPAHPVPFCEATVRACGRLREWKQEHPAATAAQLAAQFERMASAFCSLRVESDISLLRLGTDFKDANVPLAVASCSAAKASPQHLIGLLLWVCMRLVPTAAAKFPLYLKALLEYEEQDLLEEAQVRLWATSTVADNLAALPTGASISVDDIGKVKASAGMVAFLKWLDTPEEDDDDDDDDEEEEEDD